MAGNSLSLTTFLKVENAHGLVSSLLALLKDSRYTFVRGQEAKRDVPEVFTGITLKPAAPITVSMSEIGDVTKGTLNIADTCEVRTLSFFTKKGIEDSVKENLETMNPHFCFNGNQVTIRFRDEEGYRVFWIFAVEEPVNAE
jgi:hypothetical protein